MADEKEEFSTVRRPAPDADAVAALASENEVTAAAQLARLATAPAHLVLRNVRGGYGRMDVIHSIDLVLGRGQPLCLVGPNGAGKSTVLNAIFGLADVFAGDIEVAGRNVLGISASKLL